MIRKTINRRHLKDGKVYKVQLEKETGKLYLKGTDIEVEWKHTIHKDKVKTSGIGRAELGLPKEKKDPTIQDLLRLGEKYGVDFLTTGADGSLRFGDYKTIAGHKDYVPYQEINLEAHTETVMRRYQEMNARASEAGESLHREAERQLREDTPSDDGVIADIRRYFSREDGEQVILEGDFRTGRNVLRPGRFTGNTLNFRSI